MSCVAPDMVFHDGGGRLLGILCVWVGCIAVSAVVGTQARFPMDDIRGQVVDRSARPLPYVVVTSRTRNGFASQWTDLDGRFSFPGRPHRAGDLISFQTAGYAPDTVRLAGEFDDLTITLHVDSVSGPSGWTIGLTTRIEVKITDVDGMVRDPGQPVSVDQHYRLEVLAEGGRRCSRQGPAESRVDGGQVLVAMAIYVRRTGCSKVRVQYRYPFDVWFADPGPAEVRIIGRWNDVIVPVVVVP